MLTESWSADDIPIEQPSLNPTDPLHPATHVSDSIRILVVDDDPVNLKILEAVFATKQFQIKTVDRANKALALLETNDWDLLIVDVMMPGMSGYELTRKVRGRFSLSELPILLLTARSRPEDIETGFLAGANDYLSKPMDPMEF